MSEFKTVEANCISYELSIELDASVTRVWKALTGELSRWWLPSYHMLGEGSLICLEARAGGRLYEEAGERQLLWYTVLAIEPLQSISMVGYMTPQFGGPATTMLTISLKPTGNGTSLTVSDALYGKVSAGSATSLHSGWTELFSDGLKVYVEKG
jgi:uncharacterized protein YndB with AHSA1/START domain